MRRVVLWGLLLQSMVLRPSQDQPSRGVVQPKPKVDAASPSTRVALIIGNNAYSTVPRLNNAERDAAAINTILRELDFKTELVLNADLETMFRRIEAFSAVIPKGATALFYYSGHGTELDGVKYLIPIDFRGSDAIAMRTRGYPLREALERLLASPARERLVFLDACRDFPLTNARPIGSVASTQQTDLAGQDFFIAYATSSGETASDGARGANGLFTGNLVSELHSSKPNDTLDMVLQRVNARMKDQVPWLHSSLTASWYPRGVTSNPPPPKEPTVVKVTDTEEVARLRLELGNQAMFLERYEQATDHYTQSIKFMDTPAARLGRALAYTIENRLDDALSDYSQAIVLRPADPSSAYLARALVQRSRRDCPKAIEDLDTALKLDQGLQAAFRNRGLCHADLGDYTLAQKDLDAAVKLDSRDYQSLEMLAEIQLRMGEARLARDSFLSLTQLEPARPRAWLGLAQAQIALGEKDAAQESLRQALQRAEVP